LRLIRTNWGCGMAEQAVDINTLIGTYGLAVALIIIGVLFGIFKVWPWWTKRVEAADAEEQRRYEEKQREEIKRHDQYLASQNRSNDLVEKFTIAIQAVNSTMNSVAQLISTQTDRMDDYHKQVMDEIRRAK